ncbi:unnamed protein product [Closterium sp. NIES-64]|nr:unnamed protein product [Closterium sp. NIES-64]
MPQQWRPPRRFPLRCRATLSGLSMLCLVISCHVAASERIKNVVVLMMENRSFDHVLGWLQPRNAEIDGLDGSECNPIVARARDADPPAPSGDPGDSGESSLSGDSAGGGDSGESSVSGNSAGGVTFEQVCINDKARYNCSEDPDHSFKGVRNQIFGGKSVAKASSRLMRGFAQQAEEVRAGFSAEVMAAFPPAALPVTTALATNFAVCDRWFSSVPGPTHPNRYFLHAATSKGLLAERKAVLLAGFPARTIFDVLSRRKVSFGIFYHDIPASLALSSLRRWKHARRFRPIELFYAQARLGRLPAYSFVEPQYFDFSRQPGNDDHPGHDVRHGQQLIKDVYEALRAGPQWRNALLIVTYDEHGGFFDHVAPPMAGVPSPDDVVGEEDGFNFRRLGVRVPTFVISPWVDKGMVIHRPRGPYATSQFEHTSVAATLRDVFGLTAKQDVLTARDAWAGSLMPFLSLRSSPRTDCPRTLPPVTSLGATAVPYTYNGSAALTALQQDMVAIAAALTPVPVPPAAIDAFVTSLLQHEAGVFVRAAVAQFLLQQGSGGDGGGDGGDGGSGGAGVQMRVMACDRRKWWCRTVVGMQRLMGFRDSSGDASSDSGDSSDSSGGDDDADEKEKEKKKQEDKWKREEKRKGEEKRRKEKERREKEKERREKAQKGTLVASDDSL